MNATTLALVIKFIESNLDTTADFFYNDDAAMAYEIVTDTVNNTYFNAVILIYEEGYMEVVIEKLNGKNDKSLDKQEYKNLTTLKELKKIIQPIM